MAENIDAFTLISGSNIDWNGLVTVYQPRLKDIRDVGYENYQTYLNIMLLSKSHLLSTMGIQDPRIADAIDLYALLGEDPLSRDLIVKAFSFFLTEPLSYRNGSFFIGDLPVTAKILDQIKLLILELSYIKLPEQPKKPNFASKAAEELWYKLQKGKQEFEQAKAKSKSVDENMSLPNLISAVAAEHQGYNLLNIWDLTVYQLYDQFARINTKVQIDVYGQRWAAWGKEDFDTSIWFKNISRKE